jgi:hypothetical protein
MKRGRVRTVASPVVPAGKTLGRRCSGRDSHRRRGPWWRARLSVQHLRHVPLRIGHHRPGQRSHGFGAQTGLHREQKHDPVACGRAGGGQGAQHGPLLGRTDHLGLLTCMVPLRWTWLTTHTLNAHLQKNAISQRWCQEKWSIRPTSRLDCATKASLRISMGGGFPERPQRHAPHAVMRPGMVAIIVLRQLCLPLL